MGLTSALCSARDPLRGVHMRASERLDVKVPAPSYGGARAKKKNKQKRNFTRNFILKFHFLTEISQNLSDAFPAAEKDTWTDAVFSIGHGFFPSALNYLAELGMSKTASRREMEQFILDKLRKFPCDVPSDSFAAFLDWADEDKVPAVPLDVLFKTNEKNIRLELDLSVLRRTNEELLEEIDAAKKTCYELQADVEKQRKAKKTVLEFYMDKNAAWMAEVERNTALADRVEYLRNRCADLSDALREEVGKLANENEDLKFKLVNLRRGIEKRRKVVQDPKSGGRYWGFFDDREWRDVHKVIEDEHDPIMDIEVEVPFFD